MGWYYADGQEQIGPIPEEQFNQLVEQGVIRDETLVWREGLASWQAYSAVKGGVAEAGAMATCSLCSKSVRAEDTIQYEGSYICAACKPEFEQRLREGVALPGHYVYGGFWIRLCAKIVDGIVQMIVVWPLSFGFGLLIGLAGDNNAAVLVLTTVTIIFPYVVQCAYSTFFVGKFAATPGKMAFGLKVIMPDGGRVSYRRAFGRYWAEMLSGLLLLIGYIMAAFDDEKRTLHDRICSTRVVKK